MFRISLPVVGLVMVLTGCVSTAPTSVGNAPATTQGLSHTATPPTRSLMTAQAVAGQTAMQSVADILGQTGNSTPGQDPVPQAFRYIGVQRMNWPKETKPRNYSGLYTRIELRGVADANGANSDPAMNARLRSYTGEDRNWLSKLVMNKTDTATGIANISITKMGGRGESQGSSDDKGLQLAIPLYSISHSSGVDKGELWVTNLTMSNLQSPLFLLGGDTTISLRVAGEVSSDVKGHIASQVLGAVSRALQIAAPTVPLATKLSQQEVNNTAIAIDSAVSSLLSRSISEFPSEDGAANAWQKDASFRIYGCVPFVRTEGASATPGNGSDFCGRGNDFDGVRNTPIGAWDVALACPRFSVFSPRDICHSLDNVQVAADNLIDFEDRAKRKVIYQKIAAAVRDSEVLGFRLSSQISVQAFAQTQGWYVEFTSERARNKLLSDYERFCSDARFGLEGAGLSELDSSLAVRALIRHMPQLAGFRAEFTSGKAGGKCMADLAEVGV